MLLFIASGFLLTGSGFFVGFLFLKSLETTGNIFFLLLTCLLIPLGGFLLFRASKSEISIGIKKSTITTAPTGGLAEKLAENNALDQEFGKMNDARNRLKILQASGEAQES